MSTLRELAGPSLYLSNKIMKIIEPKGISFFDWGNEKIASTFNFRKDINEFTFPVYFTGKKQIYIRFGDPECIKTENIFNFLTQTVFFDLNEKFIRQNAGLSLKEGFLNCCNKKTNKTGDEILSDLNNRACHLKLNENDIIFGCDDKIKTLLEKLILTGNNIVLECTCMNKIIGSDLVSIVTNIENSKKCKILYDHNSPGSLLKNFIEKFGYLFNSKKIGSKRNKKSINLIGYNLTYGMYELINLLEVFEVKLNVAFLPAVNLKKLKQFKKADCAIICHNKIYHEIYDIINMDKIFADTPYGFKKSLKWIKIVLNYYGIKLNTSKWKKYYSDKKKKWNRLRKKAKKYKIGFICSQEDIDGLLYGSQFLEKLQIAQLLDEMGFVIRIYITDSLSPNHKIRYHVTTLNNRDLYKFIADSECVCFYSDIFCESTINCAGKNTFSYLIFDKGFEGAIKSLEKILNLCENSFFKTYRYSNKPYPKTLDIETEKLLE